MSIKIFIITGEDHAGQITETTKQSVVEDVARDTGLDPSDVYVVDGKDALVRFGDELLSRLERGDDRQKFTGFLSDMNGDTK